MHKQGELYQHALQAIIKVVSFVGEVDFWQIYSEYSNAIIKWYDE